MKISIPEIIAKVIFLESMQKLFSQFKDECDSVASGPGISGNLEKSGNFVAIEKCQGKISEFCEI